MKNDMIEWMLEDSHLQNKRMSRDRRRSGGRVTTEGFTCKNCGALVLRATWISGVLNRNHCPYCLCSRHVDWRKAGDRMSACKGVMRPVGLALKKQHKKYGVNTGELMLIHACQDCEQISINRIAADDGADLLLEVFEDAARLTQSIRETLRITGIEWLRQDQAAVVHKRLFGCEEVGRTVPAGTVP